jgi:hypothetical protein
MDASFFRVAVDYYPGACGLIIPALALWAFVG